jgi:glycerophosphoryl diester phosphodiesterase
VFQILESYTQAKSAATPSEDGMAASVFYAAVVDGSTSASLVAAPREVPASPGCMAMETLKQCIAGFPPDLTLRQAADWMTEAVRALWELFQAEGAPPTERPRPCPTASVVLYADARREVWQIGDCPFLLDGVEHRGAKAVDALLADWRARATRRLLAAGADPAALQATDPGRDAILPYLRAQIRLQNADPTQRRAFGVVDGAEIPDAYLRVYPLSPGPHRLVLATDGYPRLFDTLADTEAHLQRLLHDDPLCVDALRGTKGLRPGSASFDDRTYLSLAIS